MPQLWVHLSYAGAEYNVWSTACTFRWFLVYKPFAPLCLWRTHKHVDKAPLNAQIFFPCCVIAWLCCVCFFPHFISFGFQRSVMHRKNGREWCMMQLCSSTQASNAPIALNQGARIILPSIAMHIPHVHSVMIQLPWSINIWSIAPPR